MAKGEKQLSIVIPTLNEAYSIDDLLTYLHTAIPQNKPTEIIIADANSKDKTPQILKARDCKLITTSITNRAVQMNEGAKAATGHILYFLHADTFPPKTFVNDIIQGIEAGYEAGSFRLSFDLDHWFLDACTWFTQFNINAFRFGDQSLFFTQQAFEAIGGFDEDLKIMEDQEIVHRLNKTHSFTVVPEYVTTSARKYRKNGVYCQQWLYFKIYLLYKLGVKQKTLANKLTLL